MAVKTYDIKCAQLAEHFLQDHPKEWTAENVQALALAIQGEIEAWFAGYAPLDPTSKMHLRIGDKIVGEFED